MFVDCCRTGRCCGHHQSRDDYNGVSYMPDEHVPEFIETYKEGDDRYIPVNSNKECTYLIVNDNGFTSCSIYEYRPRMCRLYNCLTEKKVVYLKAIAEELKGKFE